MFRKTIFWVHLISGGLAGLVILMMSFTGVLLTYERQIENWFARADYLPPEEQLPQTLPLVELIELSQYRQPDFNPTTAVVINHPGAPISLRAGRSGGQQVNPYTGEEMHVGSAGLESFFSTMTGWHRWFNATGESRTTARAITGASNLVFLFLILSGIYLWLPRIWQWALFRVRLKLYRRPPSSKARDFNWHHVFGIWCAIPLAVVVATATVFNYSWANNLVYQVYGEEPPQRGRPRANQGQAESIAPLPTLEYLSLDELLVNARQIADQQFADWQSISISLPAGNAGNVDFSINQSLGGQPQKQHTLSLDRHTGNQLAIRDFSDNSPGQQTRSIIRFLHTGEVLGIWGQTVAGLVSLLSLLMVWSGFALAYRRLIQPLFKKT